MNLVFWQCFQVFRKLIPLKNFNYAGNVKKFSGIVAILKDFQVLQSSQHLVL